MHHRYLLRLFVSLFALAIFETSFVHADDGNIRRGEAAFTPAADEEQTVPAPFRLTAQTFPFEQTFQRQWDDEVRLSLVTFPSPVKTEYPSNNTVHCEYFQPTTPGKHPACVVLHILGGDFPLARMFANHLAHHGVAALFVKMPYYGERRPPDAKVRMISTDPQATVAGMTQAVKDIRFAAAWLSAQDEIDHEQLGIFGISLGGITAALAATAEPRFTKVCPVLAGGDLNAILKNSKESHLVTAKETWLAQGHTLEELLDLINKIDPCSYGNCVKGRTVLMLNAEQDEVIPRQCTTQLWETFGRPPIVWYNCGHYSAILHVLDAMDRVGKFFAGSETAEGRKQKAE
jgi:cephalosporin-C deacetylase-like acetyl esterase